MTRPLTNQEITEKMAIEFIVLPLGSRLPTFDDLETKFKASRGTLQRILNDFKVLKAIKLRSRGYKGNYIVDKDIQQLLKIAGIDHIFGSFPIPYSKSIRDTCEQVDNILKNQLSLSVSISTFSTGKERIEFLKEKKTNFIMLSKYVANKLISNNYPFEIVCDLGPDSFRNEPVLLFGQDKELVIKKGLKIGIDSTVTELEEVMRNYITDVEVEYVDMSYHELQNALDEGVIDAAYVVKDDFNLPDRYITLDYNSEVHDKLTLMNTGVILTNSEEPHISELLRSILNPPSSN